MTRCNEEIKTSLGTLSCQKKGGHRWWHEYNWVNNIHIKWRRNPFKWKVKEYNGPKGKEVQNKESSIW